MIDNEFSKRYIKARKAVIERDFAHLNPMQREAVMTTRGPLLLLAGAGSGKTTVLINRIANIVRYGDASDSTELPDGASDEKLAVVEAAASDPRSPEVELARRYAALDPTPPWRVIAITFTNKAADELKSRLVKLLGPDADGIWAMTFHSACARILRSHIEAAGFKPGFTIYDSADSLSVMKRIIKDMDLDEKTYQPKAILNKIGAVKDEFTSPEAYLESMRDSGDIRGKKIAEAFVSYARRLRESNAMDFDDLIYYTVKLLKENADIREFYQRKFRYVLVDEYQDTNNLQYMLASLLAGGLENICVVGDDDQSIYKFRGATIENILSFERRYKNARTIRLEQNYRSNGHILNAANSVIKNNLGRKGKKLWTDKDPGDKLTLHIARDEREEARYVAEQIAEHVKNGGSYSDNAILYRINALSNQLEFALRRCDIPYRVIGGTRFFDRAEVKDMLAYLSVIMTPEDDLRLRRIINTPVRGIGAATVEKAAEIAAENGLPLFNVLARADKYPELSKSARRIYAFTDMIMELRELEGSMPLADFYYLLLEKTGYVRALLEKKTDQNLTRIENVEELKTTIVNYERETGEDASLSGFMDEVALYADIEQYDAAADCVPMMTIHSAKGLEFPSVYIIGAEEGIFPLLRSIGVAEEMEEERRLCYVAITRAERSLRVCCSGSRMLFGRTNCNLPSRFLAEIPDEDIDRPDFNSASGAGGYGASVRARSTVSSTPSWSSASKTGGSAWTASGAGLAKSGAKAAASSAYKVGDEVVHRAFGKGKIAAMKPVGGDHLVEIQFESEGLKRLMLKAALGALTKV